MSTKCTYLCIFRSWNIECELITPQQCKEKCSLLNIDDLYGGLWIPGDGVGDPYKICHTIIDEAKNMGEANAFFKNYTQETNKYFRGKGF